MRRTGDNLPDNLLLFEREKNTLGGKHFHQSSRFSLIYCIQGSGTVALDTNIFEFKPGNIIFSFPWQLHCYPRVSGKIRWLFVCTDWNHPDNVFRLRGKLFRASAAERELLRRLASMWNEFCLDPAAWKADYMTCMFGTLVCGLLDQYRDIQLDISDGIHNEKLVDRINRYIFEHLRESFNIRSMAEELGYSPNYLSSVFKKKYFTTLENYIKNLRIDKAKCQLAGTAGSIGEIAAALGFSSINSFSNCFRKITGISPRHYRKQVLRKMNGTD